MLIDLKRSLLLLKAQDRDKQVQITAHQAINRREKSEVFAANRGKENNRSIKSSASFLWMLRSTKHQTSLPTSVQKHVWHKVLYPGCWITQMNQRTTQPTHQTRETFCLIFLVGSRTLRIHLMILLRIDSKSLSIQFVTSEPKLINYVIVSKNNWRFIFRQNKFAKRLDLLDPDAYSPNIEDFSESEDIFKTSQSRFFIAETNKELVDLYQQKPKYKPIQKVPKVGGLMEKLRSMKNKRSSNVCSFAKANEIDEDTKKIEVLEYSAQCRRLIVKFKFIDEPPDPDHDHHNFFYVSSDFINLFCKQVIYEVVFNLPATREITENNFVYFLKLIRASQTYWQIKSRRYLIKSFMSFNDE